jgi:hypothetical protein
MDARHKAGHDEFGHKRHFCNSGQTLMQCWDIMAWK